MDEYGVIWYLFRDEKIEKKVEFILIICNLVIKCMFLLSINLFYINVELESCNKERFV